MLQHMSRRVLVAFGGAALLLISTAMVALATGYSDGHRHGPPLTIVPVLAPRDPLPIPHSDVLERGPIESFVQNNLRPQSSAAAAAAEAQGTEGEPGILKTTTGIAHGTTLYDPGNVCNDFNHDDYWQGEGWTSYFGGWGTFAADDGYFQAKNVTFDREWVVGPGNEYDVEEQASMKIASNQPFDAGVMSPSIPVQPGDHVRVRVNYLVYNHDIENRNWDYASMGIIPKLGKRATYVNGYQRGEWAVMENEVIAKGDAIVVMLQGHSPDALNSNIYFDNVQIYINGVALSNCRG